MEVRPYMSKNYYIILGIESDATQEQIKSAYREQAKKLHPDHYGEDSAPFRELQQAYEVLSDPEQRQAYDQTFKKAKRPPVTDVYRGVEPLRSSRRAPVEPLIPTQAPARTTFRAAFEEAVSQLWQELRPYSRPATQNIQVEVSLTPEQARQGGQIQLVIPARTECPVCLGYGNTGVYRCQHCQGRGYIQAEQPVLVSYPSGVTQQTFIRASLAPLGFHNVDLNIHFNIHRSAR